MKRTLLFLSILILSIAATSLLASNAAHAATSTQIQIDKIDHVVTPIYGGLLLVNDTIRISPKTENASLEKISIGFPINYRTNLRFSSASNANDFDDKLDVILDAGLGAIGYYGVAVMFPNEVHDLLRNGQSYTFTVAFVFSDLVSSARKTINGTTEDVFTADFPLFPSLTENVLECNVTVVLPEDTKFVPGDFPFDSAQKDNRYFLNYTRRNLPTLMQESVKVSFASNPKDSFACFLLSKLRGEATLESNSRISFSELFILQSKNAFTVNKIRLKLPRDAVNVSSFDEQGRKMNVNSVDDEDNVYEVSFSIAENQSRSFTLNYGYSEGPHLVQLDFQRYKLDLSLLGNLQLMPETYTLKIVFPEGAVIQSFPQETFSVQKGVFQETLSLRVSNVTWLQNKEWSFIFNHAVLWESFRPTLWVTTLVMIGSIVAFAWRRPKAPITVSAVLVPRETLNEFVDSYEKKKKIVSELEQTKKKAKKGKISRRRYKIRKTTLENRLGTLSKKLATLQEEITRGGSKYADIIRQLEVAEVELDNIEADINRIEVRFKRGEISARTYRRLLEDDLRRREKTRTTIEGVFLRLRE